MNYNKKTVTDIDVNGKKVLLRCDFNVPQDKETGAITDDKRIRAALPTIRYLLEHNAAVIACSHLGKPKGEWKEKLTLAPVAKRLSELLGQDVIFAKDIVGEDAQAK
ncbi:MAG TPA: phosphoglycerate kinase, partial [Firmicutes bacterium]|nr:phosphoglycerate kinase [Bacillota bacterium]